MSQRILVVEEEPDIARLLRMMLEDEGYTVLLASSLEAATTQLAQTPVDLVLTDSFSPSVATALEVAQPLLAVAGRTPVVLLTGYGVTQEDARGSGFSGVIGKPFALDDLLDQVRSFLAHSDGGQHAPALEPQRSDGRLSPA